MRFAFWKGRPSPAQGGREARRRERVPCGFDIDALNASKRPAASPISMVDMSPSGLGILAALPLKAGDLLGVRLDLRDGRGVEASCRVRWVRPEGSLCACGLEFEDMGVFRRLRIGRALSPERLTTADRLTLALQDAVCILAFAVICDMIRLNPAFLSAVAAALPVLLLLGAVAAGAWLLSK